MAQDKSSTITGWCRATGGADFSRKIGGRPTSRPVYRWPASPAMF